MEIREKTECSCAKCQDMCRHVTCLPTPKDVMMLYQSGKKDQLVPGLVWDGKRQLMWPVIRPIFDQGKSACIFFTDNGLCSLHKDNLKPTEGKFAIHDQADNGLAITVASTWATPLGLAVMRLFAVAEPYLSILQILIDNFTPGKPPTP